MLPFFVGMYQVFVPCLMFSSILSTVSEATALGEGFSRHAVERIYFPLCWGAFVVFVGAMVAFTVVRLIASHKEVAVQRAIFACIAVGNAGNLPLLILQALCADYEPLKVDSQCSMHAAGYAALFCATWNFLVVRS